MVGGLGRLVAAASCVAAVAAGSANAAPMKLRQLVAVSGTTPFTACPFEAPPPFTGREWQPADTAGEPHIAVDPNRPKRVVAAWMQDFASGIVVAYSRDGGKRWRRSIPPRLSKCSGSEGAVADPRLSFGPDGALYLSTMRNLLLRPGRTTPDNEVAVSVSPDGGATWRAPVVVQARDGYNDYPMVAADPGVPGRVYLTFTKATEPIANALFTMFARSDDGGRSFSVPKPIFRDTSVLLYGATGSLLAQPNGRLLALLWNYDGLNYMPVVPDLSKTRLNALTSDDGGDTWSGPVVVGEQYPVFNVTDPESGENVRAGGVSTAAARDGGWWVAWHDLDGARGRMNLVRGRPDGTWEEPREALPWADRQILFPMVAQNPQGTVGIMWYDSRNDRLDDGKYLVDAYFAASRDGGATFEETHIAGPMDLRRSWNDPRDFTGAGQRFIGDYLGMAARPKGFVGALPFTAPVSSIGRSQLFVASLGEPPAKKRKRRHRRSRPR